MVTIGKPINSLEEYTVFINEISTKTQDGQKKTIFFRGESECYPKRLPGIFRSEKKNNKLEAEKPMFRTLVEDGTKDYYFEIFQELGWPITSFGTKLFEWIVEVQHYGAVTSILDVSTNALVGLFFACSGNHESDGKLYVYTTLTDNEKYYFGHTISIMTALNFIPRSQIDEFIEFLRALMSEFPEEVRPRIFSRSFTITDIIQKLTEEFNSETVSANIEKFGEDRFKIPFKVLNIKNGDKTITVSEDEAENQIVKLLEPFLQDDPYLSYLGGQGKQNLKIEHYQKYLLSNIERLLTPFLEQLNQNSGRNEILKFPVAIFEDIQKSYIVKPAKINERIKHQSGAFIIPGYISSKGISFENMQEKIDESIQQSIRLEYELVIPKEKKQEILEQLRIFGIDEGFIYPDIEHISRAISDKYKY
ncbi:FRG domain-containing protein [Streptococcus infantis]|uniref:FRG domain-containing protein n=1 Tax=Streptococcus infantis TaxID=68892 RepID=UPI0039C1C8FE